MRLRRLKNIEERASKVEELFLVNPSGFKGAWHTFFQNDNPIYLEVGMGKGRFVTTLAKANPNINYIGMEKSDTVTVLASERLAERLPNLIYVNADASNIFEYFSDSEIDRLYLNFSDPWPKDRHAKRRLTSPLFLERFSKILKEDGEIEFKTDNVGLFDYSLESFKEFGFESLEVTRDLHKVNPNVVMTEYEIKFSEAGQKINYTRLKNIKK